MIKNYTSSVPAAKTVSRIEGLLAKHGASHIAKSYTGGQLTALTFTVDENGRDTMIRVPIDAQAVLEVLAANIRRPRSDTMERIREQAARTAWKLMQDWIEVQLSLVEMKQAKILQVFLPYIWDGNRTFFDVLESSGFKALPSPQED